MPHRRVAPGLGLPADDNVKSVVDRLYGIAVIDALCICGFPHNIWIICMWNGVPLRYYVHLGSQPAATSASGGDEA